ncbi:hypothetical protein [Nocardia goodfellowii]|uniref:Flavodoxin-like fold domain-containing protein n=1 Tax=Nocardia goodfellowii TaxID=882446 RepID=A0ABS4QM64_9NOCA|nr:hypothetical protein [Nocardia goodfellowii]MBP2191756.1 hypothetical protein [Nocardia goodfellowii]
MRVFADRGSGRRSGTVTAFPDADLNGTWPVPDLNGQAFFSHLNIHLTETPLVNDQEVATAARQQLDKVIAALRK